MIKRVALITFIAFILLIMSAKAATLTGNVHFVVNDANGTNLNYKLYNVSSTTGSITLFGGGISTLDNNGGGTWKRVDVFPFSAATLSDGQYCIKISGDYINITNSTGALKASLYDPLFWTYVNTTGADLRFANQSSQLYFWIQDFNATTEQATIWVNIPAGSSELRLYYGNSLALPSGYENGSKVFKFFDDFTGTALDSNWVIENTYGTYSVTVNDSILTIYANAGSVAVNATTVIDYPAVVVSKVRDVNAGFSTYVRDRYLSSTTNNPFAADSGIFTNGAYYLYWAGGWTTTTPVVDSWVISKEIFIPGASFRWIRPSFDVSQATTLTTLYIKYGVGDYGAATGSGEIQFDWILVASLADPATFGTPYHVNLTAINATASINGVNLVAPVLNATVPSQTFTLPALSSSNWFNFSAESGDFSANVTFSFTSTFTQNVTANFTELVVSSDVYVPQNCTSNTLTIEFNTSNVPAGVVIYSYNLSVLVNGSEVNFTKTATESLNVWYFTISLSNLSKGWHSVKVLLFYQPAYINITVYDANNVTSLLDKTLNVTVYDQNFNILTSATVNGTANISVVFAGKVFVHISNSLGVARQLEASITPGNTTDLTFYFPTQNVVLATLQLVDYTNSFSNATVMIKRYITRNDIEVVDVQKVSANLQTSHYLIANVPYEVFITNGVDTRDLGYISVAYSQTITLYIGNILNINAYPYVGVAFSINRTNNSIIIEYKTEHGTTSSVNVVITNSTGYEVFNTTLTTQEGKVVYLINNTNETYYVCFHAENTFSPVTYKTIVSSAYTFSPVLPVLAGGSTFAVALPSLPGWMRALWFGGLAIFVGLLFRRKFVPIGLTISLAVLAVFVLTNVLNISTNLIYVLATIVMIAWFAWWRARG